MSLWNLFPKKLDGASIYGFERNGYSHPVKPIEEIFSLSGSLATGNPIVFIPEFDFELISLRAFNQAITELQITLSQKQFYPYETITIDSNSLWFKTFNNFYAKKGTVLTLQVSGENISDGKFSLLIRQVNFIDYPSSLL
jgi:hypothetical protein